MNPRHAVSRDVAIKVLPESCQGPGPRREVRFGGAAAGRDQIIPRSQGSTGSEEFDELPCIIMERGVAGAVPGLERS